MNFECILIDIAVSICSENIGNGNGNVMAMQWQCNVAYHAAFNTQNPEHLYSHSICITKSLVMLLHYFGIFSVSWSTQDFIIIKFSEF